MIYYSKSPEDTSSFAKELARELVPGDVLCLNGGLGTGKTAFVKGLTEGMGIEEFFGSPTFTIVNCYDSEPPLYHFDVYRIADSEEMYEIGYEEYVYGDGICVIEWAEIISDILPEKRIDITIEKDYNEGENYRIITIERKN